MECVRALTPRARNPQEREIPESGPATDDNGANCHGDHKYAETNCEYRAVHSWFQRPSEYSADSAFRRCGVLRAYHPGSRSNDENRL
jgi:hypothetical protein